MAMKYGLDISPAGDWGRPDRIGADWWHEYVPPRLTWDEAVRRITAGPVTAHP